MKPAIQGRTGGLVVQTSLRLPIALRDEVRAVADRNGRSLNTEIVITLREKMETERSAQK